MSHRRTSRQALAPVFAYELLAPLVFCSRKILGGVFDGHGLDVQCLNTSSAGRTCPHLFSMSSATGSLKMPAGSTRAMYSRTHMERAQETTSWRKRGTCCVRNGCITTSHPGTRWSRLCANSDTKMGGLPTAEHRWSICASSGTPRRCVRSCCSRSSSSVKRSATSKKSKSMAILRPRPRHHQRPASPTRQHNLPEMTCRLQSQTAL